MIENPFVRGGNIVSNIGWGRRVIAGTLAAGVALSLAACDPEAVGGRGGGGAAAESTADPAPNDEHTKGSDTNLIQETENGIQTCEGIHVGPLVEEDGLYSLHVTPVLSDEKITLDPKHSRVEVKLWFKAYGEGKDRVRPEERTARQSGLEGNVLVPSQHVAGLPGNLRRATMTIKSTDPKSTQVCPDNEGPFPDAQ